MANSDIVALWRDWSELEAAGIPLEPVEDRVGLDNRKRGVGLTIRAGRDGWRSEIRELKNGHFAYILPIFVRRDHPGKIIILDCWISPPWLDTNIEFLEDPTIGGHPPAYYNLPHETEPFLRKWVLNHRIHCTLSRGDIREGFLLAVGLRPPEAYANNQLIEVTVGVLDQWDFEHSAKVQMRMNRRSARHKQNRKSTRRPLFSRRDIIPPRQSFAESTAPKKESKQIDAEALHLYVEGMERIHAKHAKVLAGTKSD